MRRIMKKPCGLKVGRYAASLIDISKYLDLFPGETLSGEIRLTKLNGFFLNHMLNSWIKQAYVQGFDCGNITFKKKLARLNAWIL